MNLPHLDRLLDAYVDGALTDAERTELESLLLSNAETRSVFWSRIRLHSELRKLGRESWGRRIAAASQLPPASPTEPDEKTQVQRSPATRTSGTSRSRSLRRMPLFSALAVITIVVAGTLWWGRYGTRDGQTQPTVVATVEYAVDAPLYTGQTFGPGTMEVPRGLVQLRFCSGAVVVAQGPARLKLKSSSEVTLEEGRVQVEARDGFLVETPRAKVTDLGTRFGVSVDNNGSVEAHVFEGRLEVATSATKLQLGKDEAAAVEGAALRRISAQADAFPAPAHELSVPLAGAGFEPGTVVKAMAQMRSESVNVPLAGAGFEPGTKVHALNTPTTPGVWSGDNAEVCGLFANILPRTGRGMLRFLQVAALPETSVDQWQLVDLRPYRAVLSSGMARADFTTWFNGERSGEFSLSVLAWHGETESPLRIWMNRFKPGAHFVTSRVKTDSEPLSWQPATVELPLLGNSDFLLVHLGAGRVTNGLVTAGGQFADDATLTLRVPPRAGKARLVSR